MISEKLEKMAKVNSKVDGRRFLLRRGLITLAVGLGSCVMIFPVLWMVSMALKPQTEIFTATPKLLPHNPTLANFFLGWQRSGFSRYFLNSTFITVARVVLSVSINSLAGFGFAKYRFRGRELLFLLLLTAMMVPDQVRMVPIYTLVNKLKWINTFQAAIFPGIGLTFGAFIMRQYLSSVPDELIESARIDGCSEWRIYRQVIMPLAVPAIIVNVVFQFLWGWNDLLWPLLFLQSRNMYTVQLALAIFQNDETVTGGPVMAMSLASVLPVLLIFLVLQRHFVEGISLTGIK
jgi:alpha-1,4-digalacturonate transport system permease protein